ncbi:iron-hydroxamate transporter substrate-binding subunit [compost metagenome]
MRALKTLRASALWNAIPAVKAGEVRLFPDVAMYGALPTAVRFSQMLVDEFAREKPDAG